MKPTRIFLLVSILLGLVASLQLSSHRKDLSEETHTQKGPRPYYPKHYLGHRSEAYKEKVKEDNKKKINDFNQNNKKKLKPVGKVGEIPEVRGGYSFALEENKFTEFTYEEFIKMFTGLNRAPARHQHLKEHKGDSKETHHERKKSKSHQKFEDHLLSKLNSDMASQMQAHDFSVQSQNQNHNQEEELLDQNWSFEDPYAINDSFTDKIYGDVNQDSNWGWDWKSFDKDYYMTQEVNDYNNYWNQWEDSHWGYVSGTGQAEVFEDQSLNSGEGSNSWWWNNWFIESNTNKDNDIWWNLDSQTTTPTQTNNSQSAESNQTAQSSNSDESSNSDQSSDTEPSGPVQPKRPSNGTKPSVPINDDLGTTPLVPYPDDAMEVNWVIKGATTHIKEQGQCGSCWAFSTLGFIQSYLVIQGLGRMDLSEQQLVDCETVHSKGCDGGFLGMSIQHSVKNGLVTEEKYPYKGSQQKCIHSTGSHKIPNYVEISGRVNMEQALRKGPIAGVVHADEYFQDYKTGIHNVCVKKTPNHAIVIVGFTEDYWIVRNSWGTDWGEDGHIRIKKDQNDGNACSIEDEAYTVSQ